MTWPLVRRKMASAPLVLESSAILPKKVMKDEASPSIRKKCLKDGSPQ